MWVNETGYVKQAVIGKGGTSIVWRVVLQSDMKTDSPKLWALKRVLLKGEKDPLQSAAVKEVQTLSMLNKAKCPSAVLLREYEVDTARGVLSMVMEMGETDMARALKMREDKPLDLTFVRYYWRQMLEAVKAVHEHKVIHSDLKPANFLIVRSQLKLIDFGISKIMVDDTTKATWELPIGTLNYMSPEAVTMNYGNKAEGHIVLNRAADVWSLGCILYQMVYGRPPFDKYKTTIEKMRVIADPASISTIEYFQLKERMPHTSEDARMSQEDFERFRYTGRFDHDGVFWVPLGGAVDCMEKCLQHDYADRADIDSLLAHPFLNPDAYVNERHRFRLP
ncbi:kinase-like domain-containing protein [Catenaria anguillulae PL171]|uniref:Kinase-like domain-containing protein n=1 Tax=Catenaria anguillulae PL171 TaxID=765915 RepID=A0A1Y2HN32_9FUNG|nr:kinase-like domain-containing protein [Catenaria anguillulae PL171]